MVKMTLTDGSVFEGTVEELRQLAEVFGVAVPDGDGYDAGGDGKDVGHLCESEVVPATAEEISEATKPDQPQFAVGDYVKVQLPDGDKPHYSWGKVSNGDVGKITSINKYRIVVDFPSQSGWRAKPNELVKVDEKAAKWAKLGRKPNEFKQGDIIIDKHFGLCEVAEVEPAGFCDADRGLTTTNGKWTYKHHCTLVAPVEQRVDRDGAAK